MEKYNLIKLSTDENAFVTSAEKDYGEIYVNANSFVNLLWHFIGNNVHPHAWMFMMFMSQVKKSMTLALLSFIRRHDVQGHLMLRHALESAVFACYSLNNPDSEEFGKINEKGSVDLSDKGKENAYKWIEDNYERYSKIIEIKKKRINKLYAHSNIMTSHSNFKVTEQQVINSYFDFLEVHITKAWIWNVANISWCLLDLFLKIIRKHGGIELIENVERQV